MNTAHRASLLAPILGMLASASLAAQPLRPDGGRMLGHQDASDHVSPELDKRLAEEASAAIARLAASVVFLQALMICALFLRNSRA